MSAVKSDIASESAAARSDLVSESSVAKSDPTSDLSTVKSDLFSSAAEMSLPSPAQMAAASSAVDFKAPQVRMHRLEYPLSSLCLPHSNE